MMDMLFSYEICEQNNLLGEIWLTGLMACGVLEIANPNDIPIFPTRHL